MLCSQRLFGAASFEKFLRDLYDAYEQRNAAVAKQDIDAANKLINGLYSSRKAQINKLLPVLEAGFVELNRKYLEMKFSKKVEAKFNGELFNALPNGARAYGPNGEKYSTNSEVASVISRVKNGEVFNMRMVRREALYKMSKARASQLFGVRPLESEVLRPNGKI